MKTRAGRSLQSGRYRITTAANGLIQSSLSTTSCTGSARPEAVKLLRFDGTQITPVSNSLASTIIDRSSYYLNSQFINPAGSSVEIEGGITAATDGENIVWSRTTAAVGGIPNGVTTQQLYMNIPTGRFGYSSQYAKSNANTPYLPFGVYSNASQNAILTVASTQIATGANKFVASQMQPAYLTGAGTAELYGGAAQQNAINNFTVRFSSTSTETMLTTTLRSRSKQRLRHSQRHSAPMVWKR